MRIANPTKEKYTAQLPAPNNTTQDFLDREHHLNLYRLASVQMRLGSLAMRKREAVLGEQE